MQRSSGGMPVFGPGASYGFLAIISAMAWGLGYFGMPQVLLRFMAIREKSMIRPARIIAVTWCLIVLFAAVSIGLIGRAIYPTALNNAGSAENIFTILSLSLFPPILAGIIISSILAASMSSADSYMLIVSSSLANDIYKGVLKKEASDKQVIWTGRITMLLATIFGIVVAVSGGQTIFQVVSYAWAGLGAAFGPLILFSLFWKRTTLPAAIAGMVTGGVMVVFWRNVIAGFGGVFAVYELLPAFIFSSLVILLVSFLTKKPSQDIEREFEEAKTAEF
jgi:sodium/proline symporter